MQKVTWWDRLMCKVFGHKYPMIFEQYNTRRSNVCSRCTVTKWDV